MKYKEACPHCGSIVTAYTHNLNVPLVKALKQLVDYYEVNKKPCNLQKNLVLSKNQYNNFQKLQYFDFVMRIKEGWFPTQTGIDFIYGLVPVVTPVATISSRILDEFHPAWGTYKSIRKKLYVKEIDVLSYKQREEYQEEKSSQTTLL